jgi:ACDE family multidrug resistance protein
VGPGPRVDALDDLAPTPSLWLIFSITLTGILANTLPNAPLPDILEYFGQPDSAGGFFVASGALPGVVMAPVVGVLADRYGRRRVLIPCLVSFGVFGVAGALAPSFAVLLGLRLAQGVGAAGLVNLAVVLIGDYWHGIERARNIGYNAAVLTVSIAVLPFVGGMLTELGGWRWSFAPYGFALLTAAAVTRLPHDHADRNTAISLREQARAAGKVVRVPIIATTLLYGFVLFILIFGLFLTVLPILLDNQFGLSAGQRGLVLTASGVASTAVALNLARLRRHLGAGRLLIGSTVLFAVGFLLAGVAGTVWVVLFGVALYGLGEGASIPTMQDLVAGAASDETRGAVVAVWVSAVRLGQFVGPLIAAAGLATLGEGGTFVAAAAVTAVIGLALARSPIRGIERDHRVAG